MLEEISDSNARRRRKTLSSNEINNFLSSLASSDSENVPPNITVAETNDKEKLSELNVTKVDINDNMPPNDVVSEPTAEELIRMFCKISYKRINEQNDYKMLCDIGRKIVETTKYKLLPSRSIYPKLFPHPITSIEGKRALLLSLTPMLTEGEGQRQVDVSNCESFTRCKCEKSRKINSSYEYVDIDTNASVSSDKYEERYLNYIYRNKVKHIPPKPTNMLTTETINSNETNNEEIKLNEYFQATIMTDESNKNEINELIMDIVSPMNNINNNKLRRHTLSPASARAHMYDAIEADEDCTKLTNSNDDIVVAELGRELDDILANMDDTPIACESDINYLVDSINNDNVNDIQVVVSEENVIYTDENIVDSNTIVNENYEENNDIISANTIIEDTIIEDVVTEAVIIEDVIIEEVTHASPNIFPDLKNDEEMVQSDHNGVKIIPVDDNIDAIRPVDGSSQSCRMISVNQLDITDEVAESKAYARLFIRFEQARWKYQWELVSHQCIKKVYELNKYCV